MFASLAPLEWFAFVLGGLFVLAFTIASLWALVCVLALHRGKGTKMPPGSRAEKLQELAMAIKRNNALIALYLDVITEKVAEEKERKTN